MPLKMKDIESIFNEGYALPDLLPYEECVDGVFVMSDGSLGRVWEINQVESEGRADEDLSALIRQIEALLMRVPNDQLACQVILTSRCDVSKKVRLYEEQQEGQEGMRDFLSSKKELMKKLSSLKEIRLIFSIRFFPHWARPSFLDKALDAFQGKDRVGLHLKSQMMRHRIEFQQYLPLFEGALQQMGTMPRVFEADDLCLWVYQWLNPKRSKTINKLSIQDEEPMRNQLLFHVPHVKPEGFELEGTCMRVLTLKELPKETLPGMFTREFYDGNRFSFIDVPEDFMMVINFTVPGVQEALSRLNMHKTFAFMHQDNFMGDKSIEALEKKKELDGTIAQVFQGGSRIVKARIHWVISGGNEASVIEGAQQILGNLGRLSCEGLVEEIIGASLFLTCLPLNFDPYYEQYIRRVKRIPSGNVADMFPLMGAVRGHKTPAQIYINRRGEQVFVDFFESNINPHGLIVGASGSGKSFFVNDFILQNERLGAHFFVLDKGDSYRKLNQILNGQYVSFDLNKPITINPFVNELTPENSSFLLSLLSLMASGTDERDRLSREEEGLLQKAIGQVYEQRRADKEIVLSDLVKVLNDNVFNEQYGINSLMGPTLALRLTPFTQQGPYGGFFDGQNQFSINSRFTVFELANLSSYPDLQITVLLNLMFFMTNFVSDPVLRPKRKYLLIDEAWSLLKIKNTAAFIANAFKTFRKYRCAVVAITQELADLTRQESGMAIIANASNKIFLKQEPSIIDLLRENLSLDQGVIKALKSIETLKRKYSEAYLMTDSSSGIIRLVPDQFLYWAATSDAKDNELLMKYADGQHSLVEAIARCIKQEPEHVK